MSDERSFDPEAILAILERHGVRYVLIGGLAATLYGSPHVTTDVDITPDSDTANLDALAKALIQLDARVRVVGAADGLPFDRSAEGLARANVWNLVTRHGALDLAFVPAGTQGFDDLRRDARAISIRGVEITVASLEDVIRSKEAADRDKDRLVLPTLRRLLEAE